MMNRASLGRPGSEFGDSAMRGAHLALLAGLVLAMLLPTWAGSAFRDMLRYQRDALAAGQWWRLLSAHVVHLSTAHLAFNLLGLLLLWLLFGGLFSVRRWLLVLLAAALAVDAGLWFLSPEVGWYVGASGVLHGVWSAGAWAQWRHGRAGVVLALALPAKLVIERLHGQSVTGMDMPVVQAAHLYGALGGLLPAVLLRGKRPL